MFSFNCQDPMRKRFTLLTRPSLALAFEAVAVKKETPSPKKSLFTALCLQVRG